MLLSPSIDACRFTHHHHQGDAGRRQLAENGLRGLLGACRHQRENGRDNVVSRGIGEGMRITLAARFALWGARTTVLVVIWVDYTALVTASHGRLRQRGAQQVPRDGDWAGFRLLTGRGGVATDRGALLPGALPPESSSSPSASVWVRGLLVEKAEESTAANGPGAAPRVCIRGHGEICEA